MFHLYYSTISGIMRGGAACKRVLGMSLVLIALLALSRDAAAQLTPMGAQYYYNQYLGNPAFAGMDLGLKFNLSHRNAFLGMPGHPVTQVLTAEYQLERAGVGLFVSNDKSGFFKRGRMVGTYAYHLPLDGIDQDLHFGISLGFMNDVADRNRVVGDADDEQLAHYNDRPAYVDGDFGVVYTNRRLTLQGSIPNLNKFLKKEEYSVLDRSTFFTAVAYKFWANQENIVIEPTVTYRGLKGFDYFWDLGTNVQFVNKQVNVMAMYHSNYAATLGVGIRYREMFLQGLYTYQMAEARPYVNGNFEVNIGVLLFKEKKWKGDEATEESETKLED